MKTDMIPWETIILDEKVIAFSYKSQYSAMMLGLLPFDPLVTMIATAPDGASSAADR